MNNPAYPPEEKTVMTYTCPSCGVIRFDFAEFRLSSPQCSTCSIPMVPFAPDEEHDRPEFTPLPGDDAFAVCG